MASHGLCVPPAWQLEDDLTRRVFLSTLCTLPSQSEPSSGSHCPPLSSFPTLVDQGNSAVMVAHDHPWTLLESNLASDLNASSTLADLTSGHDSCIPSKLGYDLGSTINGFPVMDTLYQTSGEVPQCLASETVSNPLPISHATNPNPFISPFYQYMEAHSQNAVDPNTQVTLNIPHSTLDVGRFGAGYSCTNPLSSNLVDPAIRIDGLSYDQNNQMVYLEPEAVQGPLSDDLSFEQQSTLSEPVYCCEWQDESGAVCGEIITRASLPGHLSEHGIKAMRRNFRMRCNWVGCKKKRTMNRESIVRHIREVHMRLRRSPTKRATTRASLLEALGRRTNTI